MTAVTGATQAMKISPILQSRLENVDNIKLKHFATLKVSRVRHLKLESCKLTSSVVRYPIGPVRVVSAAKKPLSIGGLQIANLIIR